MPAAAQETCPDKRTVSGDMGFGLIIGTSVQVIGATRVACEAWSCSMSLHTGSFVVGWP